MTKFETKYSNLEKLTKRIIYFVVQEAILSYKFIWPDIYTWYFYLVSAIGALAGVEGVGIIIQVLLQSMIFGWLFLYMLCVANQDIGFEEDKINKPFRPYPQGIADLRYVKVRLGIIMSAYFGFSYCADIMLPAIVWWVLVIWYNYKGGHKTGFGKVVYVTIGAAVVYYTPWICVSRYLPGKSLAVAHQWFLLVEYVNIIIGILQDFRDVDGDVKSGRKTYPIMYGVKCRVCVVWLILITPLPLLFLLFEFFGGKLQTLQLIYWMVFAIICCCLAYKLMYNRNPTSDCFTYKSWCFLCGLIFGAPAFQIAKVHT